MKFFGSKNRHVRSVLPENSVTKGLSLPQRRPCSLL